MHHCKLETFTAIVKFGGILKFMSGVDIDSILIYRLCSPDLTDIASNFWAKTGVY